MQRLEDFRIFYNHTIFPELVRLEKRRRRLLTLLFISGFLLTGVLLFELYLNILILTLLLSIPIGLYLTYLLYLIQRFIANFKPKVVGLILDFIDDGINYGTLTYDPKKSLSLEDFNNSGIFEGGSEIFKGEDYIKGRIGDIDFELCELNVREMSKVRRRLNYVFKGVFLKAKLHESVNGKILILPREFKQYLSRTIKAISKEKGQNIDLTIRNADFREYFTTYATPNAKVRQLLSEEMQESILNYREQSEKSIYISFVNNTIYIAITVPKNLLEPYLFQSNVSFDLVREFFEDLHLLLRIVEDFDVHH